MNEKILLDELTGWDTQKYNKVRERIEEMCPVRFECSLRSHTELCEYFRLLMLGVYEQENHD